MSEALSNTGSCLCGAVKITAPEMSNSVGACHCGMCRKWGGGPLMAIDCGTDVWFDGGENVAVYDSSEWAERGFCGTCGSHLFYRVKETMQYIMPAGLFENSDNFVFESQIFIDKKPHYYNFANKTRNKTEAEVFEQFAATT